MVGEPLPVEDMPGSSLQARRETFWQREIAPLVLDKRIPLADDQYPYLIALEGPDDPLLACTLAIAHAERDKLLADGLLAEGVSVHRIGGWLQSTMLPTDLAAHLAAMFWLNTEVFTKATYLRQADRRVLALLRHHVVGPERVAAQLGRIQLWAYLDMQGQISTLHSPAEQSGFLRLDWKEWQLFEQGEALHRTVAQWLGEATRLGNEEVGRYPEHILYAAASRALDAARSAATIWPQRFQRLGDHTAWAVLNLLYPALQENQAVRALLAQPVVPGEPAAPIRYLHTDMAALLRGEPLGGENA
jgi:hypothetical protein